MGEEKALIILPIKRKWYEMILSGEKKEEYREIKPYYKSRFSKVFYMYPHSFIPYGQDVHEVVFRNGYSKESPSFKALCSLDIKTGREEWGAVPGVEYYTLTIKEIIWKSSDNMGGFQEGENSGAEQKTEIQRNMPGMREGAVDLQKRIHGNGDQSGGRALPAMQNIPEHPV